MTPYSGHGMQKSPKAKPLTKTKSAHPGKARKQVNNGVDTPIEVDSPGIQLPTPDGPVLDKQLIQDALKRLQKSQLNILADHSVPENIKLGRRIVRGRDRALETITFLSSLAQEGDALAMSALYKIADMSAGELADQSFEKRKALAGTVPTWPVLLSNSKSWNNQHLKDEFYTLHLAREVRLLTKLDAIATKTSNLKELIMKIMALIVRWKNEQTARELTREIGDMVREQGFGDDAASFARSQQERIVDEKLKEVTEALESLAQHLSLQRPPSSSILNRCREASVALPPLTENHKVQNLWFVTVMSILESLTAGEYHLRRYGLRNWGGFKFISERDDAQQKSDVKASIRDQMKKAFHKMIDAGDE